MGRPTKKQRLHTVHQEALAEFDIIQSSLRDERLQSLKDRRFYSIAGAQWEGPLGEQFENRPKLEVNKIHLSVIRIINEYRNNRITVNFVSKDGVEDDRLADTCDGLYRADEQDSGAEEAYDNAFEEAVGGGFGAWRLSTKYEDEEDPDDDKQRICIEPIFDADSSVFFDLQAKRQDKSDATRGWIITSMTRAAYEDEYGDDHSSWPKSIHQHEFDWLTPDVVFVAEYYKVEITREVIYIWEKLDGTEERFTEEQLSDEKEEELLAIGAREVRQKRLRRKKIHKYIMSGNSVLEDCGLIAGQCIPIIPVYGKRWFVDNIERYMGHVRLAKDTQMLKNMQLSKLAEVSALSSTAKPIVTPEQMAGHQEMWSKDNIKNFPYLLLNALVDKDGNEMPSGPLAYTRPPEIAPALAALLQITEADIQDLLGNQQNGEEIQGNVSTETASLVQNRLDMQTFIYMSNMAKAIKRCGIVWLSMAKDVLVEEGRVMKSIGYQGELERIELLKPITEKSGEVVYENDLTRAKLDVSVEVGPSSSTKRAATIRSLTNMARTTDDPETKQVLGAMIMMNMEGEGISDVRAFFRKKLLKMGVVKPTDQEARDLAEEAEAAEPSANDKYLEAAAGAEEARGSEAQSKTILNQAKADKTRAETIETLTDVDIAEGKQAMDVIEKLGPRVVPPSTPGSDVQE